MLNVGPEITVEIPVKDIKGRIQHCVEKAHISTSTRFPLLASAQKPLVKGIPESAKAVKVEDKTGKKFWVPIHEKNGLPVIKIENKNVSGTLKALILEKEIDKKPKTRKQKQEMLKLLHLRFAHSTGRKLFLTLKEKGWGDVFTEKMCHNIQCDVCRALNRKKESIPQVADVKRQSLSAGEIAYQDLTKMPLGLGGFEYVSLIVDAHTRRCAGMALKRKDQALTHTIAYVRRLENEGLRVKRWRSDNGGEFANKEYEAFLLKEGIAQEFGAPYTPQTQGLVERANGTFKRLLGKVLRSLGVPVSLWPGFLPGVIQAMNSVVHTSTGKSPYAAAGDVQAFSIPKLVVGDVVQVVDPQDKSVLEGYYGGQISNQVASVVVRSVSGGWRIIRIHPTYVKLVAWQGQGVMPQKAYGGLRTVSNEAQDPVLPYNAAQYDVLDTCRRRLYCS